MTVAVIDSGIYNKGSLKNKIAAKIKFVPDDKIRAEDELSATSHGTTCAEIINSICPETQFLDLTAICRDGTTQVANLLEALEWCVHNRIKLIHLSLGTVNYFDIGPLEGRIKRLTDQNAIIVAAYHNRNIKTYPAAFPRVFGVRQDRKGILEKNQFLFQIQTEYNCENSIVAHWWGEDEDCRVNSYAAPVITGYAARALLKNKDADFYGVLDFLKENATYGKQYPDRIERVIKHKEAVNIPIVVGMGLYHGEMKLLADSFKREGYQTLLLQEQTTDTVAIPMEYYGGKDVSLEQMIHTVDVIYEPNIILLDFISGNMYNSQKEPTVDMCISYDTGMYKITAERMVKTTRELAELYHIIRQYFE